MALSAAQLREHLYRLLDQVLETGVPLEIEHKGQRLRIAPAGSRSKLDRVVGRPDSSWETLTRSYGWTGRESDARDPGSTNRARLIPCRRRST